MTASLTAAAAWYPQTVRATPFDATVLRALARWVNRRGTWPTLDELAGMWPYPESRPWVFAAVAKLEDQGQIPRGVVR